MKQAVVLLIALLMAIGCNPSWKSAGILKQGVVDCVVTQGTYTWGRTCYRGHGGRNVWVSTETCTINQKTGEHYDCLVQKWEGANAQETG